MSAHRLAAFPLRHSLRLRTAAIALALAAFLAATLGACALPGSKSTGHACSDKVAQAVVTFKSVPGLWNCLSPSLQNTLHTYGLQGDNAFVPTNSATSAALAYQYVASHGDMDVYVVTMKPDSKGHIQTLGLLIWTDGAGKVTHVGVGAPSL